MRINRIAVVSIVAVTLSVSGLSAQIGGQPLAAGGAGLAGRRPPSNLPETPTAVALPTLSAEITGPGPMFDSAPSLAPGKGLAAFGYEAHEYFVSGTANGEPYTTRLVVRKPRRQLEVQRPRAGRGDARQRRRAHVRVHVDLHDVVGPRRRGDPDDAARAVRRAQRAALSGHEAERRADQRDPGAGRGARPRAARSSAARCGRWCWPARR